MGFRVAVLTLALVGGRQFWLWVERPAHRQEIAAAYSVGLFSETPQPDGTGKHVTFVETSDKGFAVFLVDTTTRHKINVREEDALGLWGHFCDLHVWPWAPDDSAFIYSAGGEINICNPEEGKVLATVNMPTDVSSLAWLNEKAFVCFGTNDRLYHFTKQPNGTWCVPLCLRSTGGTGTASAEDGRNGVNAENVFQQNTTVDWVSGKASAPIWLQYEFKGAAWIISQYALVSSSGGSSADPCDWQLLASDDGERWSVMDVRTNEIFTARSQTKQYEFLNQTPHQFYRLNITGVLGGAGSHARLAKWQLFSIDQPDSAAASTENSPYESSAKAFDDSTATKWYNNSRPSPWWLQYQFGGGAAWAVCQYDLASANDAPERDPQVWEFQASNDGTNWTTLDVRNGEKFTSRWQTKSYSCSNATPYRIYRLNIIRNAKDDESGLQLSEFGLLATNSLGQFSRVSHLEGAFLNALSLAALSSNTIAWGQGDCLWSLSLTNPVPRQLLDLQKAAPANTTLRSFDYSRKTGQFLLNCERNRKSCLYRFDGRDIESDLKPVTTPANIHDAIWINNDRQGDWVARKNDSLVMRQSGVSSSMTELLARAHLDAFNVTADGRQLFMLGTVSNEPSASIWQYDLTSSQLSCAVPYADFPSPYAVKVSPVRDFILSDSGKYTIYLPADFYRHPHRQCPLVIGNTDFGIVVNSAHGRLWVPAMAACGACVVIVNRTNWFNGIEKWSDNVATAYEHISAYVPIDKNRVYLFAVSAETAYLAPFLTNSPVACKGVMLLNPSGLPDLSGMSPFKPKPRILISAGGLEGEEGRLKQYQSDALKSGVMVDVVIAPYEKHHFVGNAAQLQRTTAMMHFIFEE